MGRPYTDQYSESNFRDAQRLGCSVDLSLWFAEPDRKAPSKSDDEIAKIKAANLQRMKDVSLGRKHYNNVAGPSGPGVENFDPVKAKAQVAAFMNGDDDAMNDSPRFLSKAELNVIL